MSGLVTIYGLFDPRSPEIITYVGYTRCPDKRLAEHRSEFKGRHRKARWVAYLRSFYLRPSMRVLEVVPFDTRKEAECRWIAHWLERNPALLNAAPGGGGPPRLDDPAWRAARSRTMLVVNNRPEVRAKHARPHLWSKGRFLFGPRLKNGKFTSDRRDLRPQRWGEKRRARRRETETQRRAERRAAGLCWKCGGARDDECVSCSHCRRFNRQSWRNRGANQEYNPAL